MRTRMCLHVAQSIIKQISFYGFTRARPALTSSYFISVKVLGKRYVRVIRNAGGSEITAYSPVHYLFSIFKPLNFPKSEIRVAHKHDENCLHRENVLKRQSFF